MRRTLGEISALASAVRRDCEQDAERVDQTPFTGAGVGKTFGSTLAMIAVLAECVADLADELAREPVA